MEFLDGVDWQEFMVEHETLRTNEQKAAHLFKYRQHFDCKPDWVTSEV